MSNVHSKMFVILFMLLVTSTLVQAATVTYDYEGRDFIIFNAKDPLTGILTSTNTLPSSLGRRITGSVNFADGIDNPVTSYFFSDGINSFDNTMSFFQSEVFLNFVNGNVDDWGIVLWKINASVSNKLVSTKLGDFESFGISQDGSSIVFDEAFSFRAGTWSLRQEQVSAVPVPASFPLMASAFGLFAFLRQRKLI